MEEQPSQSRQYHRVIETTIVPRQPTLDTATMGKVIWFDESSSTVFKTTGRVLIQRTLAENFHVESLVPTVKHERDSVTVWGALSWRGLKPLIVLRENVIGKHYRCILADNFQSLLQIRHHGERPLFKDENSFVYTGRRVQKWLNQHNDEVEHHSQCPQSSDRNSIEPLQDFLENNVCVSFRYSCTLADHEFALHEEWLKFPLFLCTSFIVNPTVKSVIRAIGGLTPQ